MKNLFFNALNDVLDCNSKVQVQDWAEYLNVTEQAVYSWKRGNSIPNPERLLRIVTFFDCPRPNEDEALKSFFEMAEMPIEMVTNEPHKFKKSSSVSEYLLKPIQRRVFEFSESLPFRSRLEFFRLSNSLLNQLIGFFAEGGESRNAMDKVCSLRMKSYASYSGNFDFIYKDNWNTLGSNEPSNHEDPVNTEKEPMESQLGELSRHLFAFISQHLTIQESPERVREPDDLGDKNLKYKVMFDFGKSQNPISPLSGRLDNYSNGFRKFLFSDRNSIWGIDPFRQLGTPPRYNRPIAVELPNATELIDQLYQRVLESIRDFAYHEGEIAPSFPALSEFKRKDWLQLSFMMNKVIKSMFTSVELDSKGKIVQGSTGKTTIQSKESRYIQNGTLIIDYEEEFITTESLRRFFKHPYNEHQDFWSEKALDIICIAAGFDGLWGFMNELGAGNDFSKERVCLSFK
jgi:hypothetical protein